jgi:protein ImuB
MRRVVSIWFSTLPTDRLRQRGNAAPKGAPLVTAGSDGRRQVVAAADATAAGLGLRPGMPLAQAQALVPGLAIHPAEPDADAETLRRMASWCLRYAPLASPDPPNGIWIDVTGSTHLHGGEAAMLRDLVGRFAAFGMEARAAIADTPGAAHALARYARPPSWPELKKGLPLPLRERAGERGRNPNDDAAMTPPPRPHPQGGGECFLSTLSTPSTPPLLPLPIEALRLPPAICDGLHLMGFDRIGQLADTPRGPLVRRFGSIVATRLDQLSGTVFEPIVPVIPPDLIQARLTFVEPLLTEPAFSAVIARLTGLVCTDLEKTGQGARRLDLLFERVDGATPSIRVGTARPSRDPRHLARMLDERLERIDPGLGVEAMRLIVTRADTAPQTQTAVLAERTEAPIAELVDRLSNRLGASRIFRNEPVESDVPERSVRRVPALERKGGTTWPADLPRPIRLLDPPQPVEAMALLPDHPPLAFTWRRVRHRVRHADGPERIAGEWWKRDGEMRSVRDYFRVEDEEGRRFWLFRRGDGDDPATGDRRWFLHGFF